MKFSIEKSTFVNGLQQGINVVASKVMMPILNNVLLEAADDVLSLTTSGLDLGVRCQVYADVRVPGRITLPAKKLATIVRALPSENIELELHGTCVSLSSGSAHFEIMGLPAEEFPALPMSADQGRYTIGQSEFLRLLKNVSYAQSRDGNRYILNGVYFSLDEGVLTVVATDGRRLSMMNKSLGDKVSVPGVIVPSKTIAEVERLLGQGENMWFAFGDNQVIFGISVGADEKSGLLGDVTIVSKVIDGNYPNFKQVIPHNTENRVKIDRQLLLESIQRVALVTSENKNSVKLHFMPNVLEISAASAEYGQSHEKIAIAYDGPEVEVAFNPIFLCDPLKALVQDEVFFEFKDELSPGVFKTLDSFLCVVMPLRVG